VEKGGDVCSVMIVAVAEVTATINACDFSHPFLDDQLIIYCNNSGILKEQQDE
jgi:5'(3')-deoxyribonucleotidase